MITIRNLNFSYPGRESLFAGLDLTLTSGSITGLLGKNGAGKSSLLKLISGLLFPGSGVIDVLSHTPGKRQPSFLSKLCFVPEEFHLPPVSMRTYVWANSAFYPRFDPALMDRLMAEFELAPDHRLDRISYGQKKKFLISFALATRSPLLILDEPTNGLDIPSKSIFRKIMAGSLEENQLVFISTHQVRDVESLVDRLIVIDNGSIVLDKALIEIASQLHFETTHQVGGNVLYSEVVPGGYRCISRQTNGSSFVDIELLFNAIATGKKIL